MKHQHSTSAICTQKLGETEKARKYLVEFLQVTPYSGGRDSQWIKAKTLLLELYSLEGEF